MHTYNTVHVRNHMYQCTYQCTYVRISQCAQCRRYHRDGNPTRILILHLGLVITRTFCELGNLLCSVRTVLVRSRKRYGRKVNGNVRYRTVQLRYSGISTFCHAVPYINLPYRIYSRSVENNLKMILTHATYWY